MSREHEGAYMLEILSIARNALGGYCEATVELATLDTWYWKTFRGDMKKIWETDKVIHLSSRDKDQIEDLSTQPGWTNEARLHLAQGLQRSKEISKQRVNLPDFGYDLVDASV